MEHLAPSFTGMVDLFCGYLMIPARELEALLKELKKYLSSSSSDGRVD